MTKLLFTSDLHGRHYEDIFSAASTIQGLDGILIGGDVAIAGSPKQQQDFIRKDFARILEKYSQSLPPIYIIPGNDDWKVVQTELENLSRTHNLIVPTEQAFQLAPNLSIVGYPYVPITPFSMKDFEKWDGNMDELIAWNQSVLGTPKGYVSEGLEIKKATLTQEETISKDLKKIARYSDPRKTIYLFHSPPKGIFDETFNGNHVGSRAMLDFIAREKPYLALHGHIHEALKSKKYHFSCFDSTLAACGQNSKDGAYYLTIDLNDSARPFIQRRHTKN